MRFLSHDLPAHVRCLVFVMLLGGCNRAMDGAAAQAARAAAEEQFNSSLAEGDRAFEHRGDPTKVEVALRAYGRAASMRPGDPAAEVRLSRTEAFRALAAGSPEVARAAWEASARAAERALRKLQTPWAEAIDRGDDAAAAASLVEGSGSEPLYLLAQGTMRAAQATGYAAVLAVKDAALAMMARAAELDERVDAAGPHRALGAWRAMLPVAAGGGATPSRGHFDRARALFPGEPLTSVAEAETWAVLVQDKARFEVLLGEVIAMEPGAVPGRAPEAIIAKRRARELLGREAQLF